MALSIGTLVGYLSLDDSNFNRKADNADRKINGLKLHLEALKRTNPKISVEVDTQTAKLDELKARIAALKAQAAQGVDVRVDMVEAMVKLDAVQAKLRALHNEEVRVRVDVDDAAAVAKVASLKAQLDSLPKTWNPSLMTTAVAGFGPALLPVITAAAGGMVALGAGAASAAGGIGVLKLAYHGLSAEVQAYQKYQAAMDLATTKAQRQSAQAALQSSAYGQAGAPAKSMTRFLFNKGMPAAHELQGTAQRAVFPGTEKSLRILIRDLPVADRLVSRFGHTMGAMEVSAAHALTNPFWTQWFNWLGKTAKTDLPLVGSIFGNTFEGIARMIQRFAPEGTSLLTWLDNVTKRFSDWTAGSKGSSFAAFMREVPKDARAFAGAMKAAGPVVGNLLKGLNSAGVSELHLLADGLRLISKIPPGPLRAIGEALPAIVLGMKGIAMVRGVASAVAGLRGLAGLKFGRGLGGTVAGEVGGVALGKGVVPVFVTNKGFGVPGTPGEPGVPGPGKFGVPLVSTLGTIGAIGGLVTGGLAAENLLINHLQRFKPSTLNVPYAPNVNAPQGAYQHEMSASAIKAAQMNVGDPETVKRYNDQLTKLIALDRKLYPAANSAQAGVDALGKGFESLIQTDPSKAMGSLQHVSELTGISIKHLAQLMPGLGAAMKAAGIPTTKLGVELASLPKGVQTKIETPGAIQSMSDVKKLAAQYNLTPKQIRTIVQLSGAATAAAQIRAYANQMAALNGRVATTYLRQVTQHVIAGGGRPVAVKADGGRVIGPGTGTSDSIPARLSNGEYVVKASAVRKYGVSVFDALNAESFASGGHVKKKKLTPAERRRRALAHRLGGARHALGHTNALIGNANAFGDAFAGNVFGAGLATTKDVAVPSKVFTTTINGQTVTESTPGTTKTVDLSSQQILKEMLDYQRQQKTQAVGLASDVKKLRKMGVSKSLIAQMQSSGAQGVAEIHALASGSKSQVHQFNTLNAQTTAALHQAGAQAVAGQSMAALQRQKSSEEAIVRGIKRGLHGVSVQIKHSHLRVN